jgi:membrane-associated protease RseP (regulator of RpoE activity)
VLEPESIGPAQSLQDFPAKGFTARWPRNWWWNASLFLLTLGSTTLFGAVLARSFAAGRALDLDGLFDGYARCLHGDLAIWPGLSFSLPLLCILLAHELGHYVECRRLRVDASLPYFLPTPTLFGTMGAFIRIRSPICTREGLFDIGIAGPIAGFLALLPFLLGGVYLSHVAPAAQVSDQFVLGVPWTLRMVEWLRFGQAQPEHILLHPMAMSAWVGLLATAMNLIPMGQLDGGHIIYALWGQRWHRIVSTTVVGVLVLLGFLYWPWWFWAVITFFFLRRHPLVYDQEPLSRGRLALALAALVLFALSLSIVPIRTL